MRKQKNAQHVKRHLMGAKTKSSAKTLANRNTIGVNRGQSGVVINENLLFL
jgi:hypothetical protein